MKKIQLFVLVSLCLLGRGFGQGHSSEKIAQDLESLGRLIVESLQQNKPELLVKIAYQKEGLIATMNAQTKNEEVRAALSKELDREGFDEKMRNEMEKRHGYLYKQEYATEKIDWTKIEYSDFKFEEQKERTEGSGIQMGTGYVHFMYEGREYKIKLQKMAKLLEGWRGNDLAQQATLVYRNQ